MKKLLLLMGLVSCSLFVGAQCSNNTTLVQDFSNTSGRTPPPCWQMFPSDNLFDFNAGTASFYGKDRVLLLPSVENLQGVLKFKASHPFNGTFSGAFVIVGLYRGNIFTEITRKDYGTKGWKSFTIDLGSFPGSSNYRGAIAFKTTTQGSRSKLVLDDIEYLSKCFNSDSAIALAKDVTVKLDKDGIVLVNPIQVDNGSIKSCEEPITNLSLDKTLFQCGDLGKQQVVLTANDGFGHSDTDTAIITVEPTLNFGTIRYGGIALDSVGNFTPSETYVVNSSTSTNCPSITYSFDTTRFDCSKVGQSHLFTTQMLYGNDTAVASSYVNIRDLIAPDVVSNDIEVTLDATTVTAQITTDMLVSSASDACGIKEITLSHTSFDCTNLGDNEVTITVTDSSNNVKEVKVNVKVISYIPSSEVEVLNPNTCAGEKVNINIKNSYDGAQYYLKNVTDSSVIGGPVAGNGNDIIITSDTINKKESLYVYAEVADSSKALYLSATGDYLKLNSPGSFDYSKGYTFSAWVKNTWGQSNIWSKPIFYAGSAESSDIEIFVLANGSKLRVLHNRENGVVNGYVTTTSDMPNNEYFHLSVTYANTQLSVYVNGNLVNKTTLTAPLKTGTVMSLGYFINTKFPDAQYSFDGYLDDVRLYDTARTAEAINDDMNRCLQGTEDNLILYYPMEEKTGSILFDKVSNTPAQLGQNGGGSPATLSLNNAVSCKYCSIIMDTTLEVGDIEAPDVISQDIVLELNNGVALFNAKMLDDGSNDNCTDDIDLTFSMDLVDSAKALNLSGTNDYLLASTPTDFDYSKGYTFSAWIKSTWTNSYDPIFYAGGFTGSDIEIYVNNTNSRLTLLYNRGNGGRMSSESRAYLPTDNKYFHLAITYNGIYTNVYLNGILQRSARLNPPIKSQNSELSFGHFKSSTFIYGQQFNGLLDDIRVYDVARTSEEIIADMNNCLIGDEDNLVVYLPVNDSPIQINKVDGFSAQVIGSTSNTLSTDISVVGNCGGKTFTAKGDYDVTLLVEDSEGNIDSSTAVVTVNDPVGLNENVIKGEHLSVYPNPTSSLFKVDAKDVLLISVLSGNGHVLLTETNNEVDVSSLSNGLYILKVQTLVGVYMEKILKK